MPVNELNGVVHELRSLASGMERYLRQELGTNLESRLKSWKKTGYDVALLRLIEQLITRHGLVEFRSRIDSLCVPPGRQQPGSGALRSGE